MISTMCYQKLKRLIYTPLMLIPVTILLLTGCAERQIIPLYDDRLPKKLPEEQISVPPVVADPEEVFKMPAPLEPIDETDDLLLPMLTHINERILAYETKLLSLGELEFKVIGLGGIGDMEVTISDCRFQMEDILSRYNELHRQLLMTQKVGSDDLIKGEAVLNLWDDDFRFLGSKCINLVGINGDARKTAFPVDNELINRKGLFLTDAYKEHDYWLVVDEYEKLSAVHGNLLSDDITFLYGQALLRIGRGGDATRVFKELLTRVQTQAEAGWEYQLTQLVADMEFAHGNFSTAKQFYGEIVDAYHSLSQRSQWASRQLSVLEVAGGEEEEVRAYADFLRSYLTYNPERDGFLVVQKAEKFINRFPHSTVTASMDFLKINAERKAEEWYQKLIDNIHKLNQEGKHQEALVTIEKVPRMILPLENQLELADLAGKIRAKKSLAIAERQLDEKLLIQESWNEGMTHLDSEHYDQAIASFSRLLATADAGRAQKKINEIANHAAGEDRRRAAELFVRANRTHDMESKKKLLLASRQLLQNILVKYPQADVAGKAEQNLSRIEKEIYAIDPSLIHKPVEMDGEHGLMD